jgi:hypothetical protein
MVLRGALGGGECTDTKELGESERDVAWSGFRSESDFESEGDHEFGESDLEESYSEKKNNIRALGLISNQARSLTLSELR